MEGHRGLKRIAFIGLEKKANLRCGAAAILQGGASFSARIRQGGAVDEDEASLQGLASALEGELEFEGASRWE